MSEKEIDCKCKCGRDFKRPESLLNHEYKRFFKNKLENCDSCFKEKVEKALKNLPEILKILAE